MLDAKLLRTKPEWVAEKLRLKGYLLDIQQVTSIETNRKQLQVEKERLEQERNELSKRIGQSKHQGLNCDALLQQVAQVNEKLALISQKYTETQMQIDELSASMPNILHESVPEGSSENDNLEIKKVGQIPQFDFTPKDHVELGEINNLMDFSLAAKVTGSRFVVLRNGLARLQRALIQFMLDIHTKEHGYQEFYVPYLANRDSFFGTSQLPKFEEDLFFCRDESYALIPTAEVSLTNIVRDTIIDAVNLPLKFVTHTPCFRREAGSYGKDMRGMIRQHQFEKVELVQIVTPEVSYAVHEELTQHAEAILQRLELPYRVVLLCSADTSFSAAKTYDLEVWLPGQSRYREISSCSNFEAFQARRLQARYREKETNKINYVHTLNGSGLAVGRTLVAIMENYQDEKGNIHIPKALQPYIDGEEIIKR
jgi:seryl-tRNA synthetase